MNKQILENVINDVFSYVGNTNDWMIIKKELLKSLPPADRIYFSTRDPITKKQTINKFEEIVIEKWYIMTGNRPILIDHNEKRRT